MASWLARREDVRTRFELLAWVPLGQTPNMDKCQELLHLQLTGGELSKSAGPEERREKLQELWPVWEKEGEPKFFLIQQLEQFHDPDPAGPHWSITTKLPTAYRHSYYYLQLLAVAMPGNTGAVCI